jgi:hypothetical protein
LFIYVKIGIPIIIVPIPESKKPISLPDIIPIIIAKIIIVIPIIIPIFELNFFKMINYIKILEGYKFYGILLLEKLITIVKSFIDLKYGDYTLNRSIYSYKKWN